MNTKSLAAIALTLVVVCPVALGYMLAVHDDPVQGWETVETNNISDLLLNHQTPYESTFYGVSNNDNLRYNGADISPDYVRFSSTVTAYPARDNTPVTLYKEGYYVNAPLGFSWTATLAPGMGFMVDDGTDWGTSSNLAVSYDSSTSTFNAGGLGNFHVNESIKISADSITIYKNEPTGQYADISEGWTLPFNSGVSWENGQTNTSVTFIVNLPSGSNLDIGYATRPHIVNNGGTISVNDSVLGSYSVIKIVVFGNERVTVSGLSGWPTMGANVKTYNTVTVDHDGPILPLNYPLLIESTSTVKPILRVDSAQIVAGTFPSTYDYDLNLAALYPGRTLNIKLNSIGVYGDYLRIGNVELPINNGAVSINGKTIGLKGALFSFFEDESGNIESMLNNTVVGTFDDLPIIRFGGEWSLTATAYLLEEITTTKTTWHAGEFGLDKTGLVACGLILAIAAFVVCGMSGKRSGAKVALLAMVCGGAALVYLIML